MAKEHSAEEEHRNGQIHTPTEPLSLEEIRESSEAAVAQRKLEEARRQETELREELGVDSSEKTKSGRAPKIVLAILLVLLLIAGGFFGLKAYEESQDRAAEKKVQVEEEQKEEQKAEAISEAENPFAVLIGEVNPPSEEPLVAEVSEDQIKAGSSTLTVAGSKLRATVNGCTATTVTDMCLAARGTLGDSGFDVVLLKDISRTRILDDPSDFLELDTPGKTIAATMAIDIQGSENPTPVGALTANGTTGFVFIFPEGTTSEKAKEVLAASTVI